MNLWEKKAWYKNKLNEEVRIHDYELKAFYDGAASPEPPDTWASCILDYFRDIAKDIGFEELCHSMDGVIFFGHPDGYFLSATTNGSMVEKAYIHFQTEQDTLTNTDIAERIGSYPTEQEKKITHYCIRIHSELRGNFRAIQAQANPAEHFYYLDNDLLKIMLVAEDHIEEEKKETVKHSRLMALPQWVRQLIKAEEVPEKPQNHPSFVFS